MIGKPAHSACSLRFQINRKTPSTLNGGNDAGGKECLLTDGMNWKPKDSHHE